MRSTISAFLGAMLLAFSALVCAHPGHGKEITPETAVRRAAVEVDRLAEEGKIEKSWVLQRQAGQATLKKKGADEEWMVTFDNPSSTDPAKRRLFVFLTASGDDVAANFSGK